MLLAESLPFPPLLLGPDSHGQTEVRIKFLGLLYMGISTYYLEDSTCYCNRHVYMYTIYIYMSIYYYVYIHGTNTGGTTTVPPSAAPQLPQSGSVVTPPPRADVIPQTGLTTTETALLSPEEQIIRLRNRT